ncbi:hypothetical protein LSAT2_013383 [Lamellibrachia satsuma]|nr:hypothetical protein LSAT2_013383 [Lamellibrachia satsuma]
MSVSSFIKPSVFWASISLCDDRCMTFHHTSPEMLWTAVSKMKMTATAMPVWSVQPVLAIQANRDSDVTASTAISVTMATTSDFVPMFQRYYPSGDVYNISGCNQ